MPLFAILHVDTEGLHAHSCSLVEAQSKAEIAQHILTYPTVWQPLFEQVYTSEDSRSLWERMQQGELTIERLINEINQTECYQDGMEQVRLAQVDVQALDQLQPRTRWTTVGVLRLNSIPDLNATAVPLTLDQLLTSITESRWRDRREIASQLHRIQQHFDDETQRLQQQEQRLTGVHTVQLDRLRPFLATDARSLFDTVLFQQFVQQELVTNPPVNPWNLPANFQQWVLRSQVLPLHFSKIQPIVPAAASQQSGVQMQVQLKAWAQTLQVTIAQPPGGVVPLDRFSSLTEQWSEICAQLEPHLAALPIAPELHDLVMQELTAIAVFVAQTFFLPRLSDRFPELVSV